MESCLRSIIDHFEPATQLGWDEIDALTNKQPGKWSWPQFANKNMLERGYLVKRIAWGSPQDIVSKGVRQYLVDLQGEEAAEITIKNSVAIADIEEACRSLLAHPNHRHEKRVPAFDDIEANLKEGFLLISMVNQRILNSKEGYAGHSVLIYDMDDEYVYMQDSGLPAFAERKVAHDDFLIAATSPKETNWALTAYKYNPV